MIARDSLTGRAITWMRFPLALIVLTAHTIYNRLAGEQVLAVMTFLTWCICTLAVPLFFLISGYLFFAGRETFGIGDYLAAMRRRVRTLLVPYVLWMLIAWASVSIESGEIFRVSSLWEFKEVFWGGSIINYRTSVFGTRTINLDLPGMLYPLWFLRDLMCVSLLTPLIWLVGKRCRLWAILPFAVIYLAGVGTNLDCLQPKTLFYFPVGAILAINRIDIAGPARKALPYTLPAWLVMALIYTGMALTFDLNHLTMGFRSQFFHQCMKLAGVAAFVGIAFAAVGAERPSRALSRTNELFFKLAPTSMFIYLIHGTQPIEWLNKLCQYLFEGVGPEGGMLGLQPIAFFVEHTQLGQIMTFVTAWVVRLAVILCVYRLLQRYAPRVLGVLTGDRSQVEGARRPGAEGRPALDTLTSNT